MPNQLIKQLVFGVILIVVGVFLVITYFPPRHSEDDNEAYLIYSNTNQQPQGLKLDKLRVM